MRISSVLAVVLAVVLAAGLALAPAASHAIQGPPGDEPGADRQQARNEADAPEALHLTEERSSATSHSIVLDGETVEYTATAGRLLLKDDDGTKKGAVFYVAYTRDGVEDPGERPVTFSFNGGPGAAAVWVHMGAFGPKIVKMTDEGWPLPPPGQLEDNPHSVLDVTDLVFIDPVSTGWSRAVPGQDPKQFHGLEEDVEAVGEFIRLWTTRNQRWASPKFLAGESYGTTRDAGLSGYLQDVVGMYLNGIVQISSVMNWQTLLFQVGNDMPYIAFLPTYTATARYHDRLDEELSGDLRATLDRVEEFALGEYADALLQGDALADEERREVAEKLARFTGLDVEYVLRSDLRIRASRFRKELLRDEGVIVGRLDSRFTGFDRDDVGDMPEYDPASAAFDVGYVTMLNDYLRRDLGFESDLRYRSLAREVWPWSFDEHENRYVNVAETLRRAMVKNPSLKVLITSGYYDLATPYFGSDYTVDHMGLPEELRDNIRVAYYEAGHMMYVREADHAKFKRDIVELIRDATPDYAE